MSTSSICLCMIVKNEAHILPRFIESVRPLIDAWSIVDTGSTDDTIKVIYDELGDIPGQLIEEPFIDFAWNRTSAVRHAQESGKDYFLLLDADHEVVVDAPNPFDNLTADAYLIELIDHDLRYRMPYLVRAGVSWRYFSPTHEYLGADEPFVTELHQGLSIVHHSDGGTRPEKIDRDMRLLERAYTEDPKNERTTFYLAQTYEGAGRRDDAIRLYRERIELGGSWAEEVYIAKLRLARLTDATDDYLSACSFRPERPEALHDLAKRFNHLGAHGLALAVCESWSGWPSQDVLFVEREPENYGIEFEKAVALFWVGRKEESKALFLDLMQRELPEHYRDICVYNLQFFEESQ